MQNQDSHFYIRCNNQLKTTLSFITNLSAAPHSILIAFLLLLNDSSCSATSDFSLQGLMLILSTRHVRFAVSQWCREGWWCQGRKMKGEGYSCASGVLMLMLMCLEETWKPRSWSGLRRHWDHILKTAAWDDAKKTSYWWKKYDTDFNYFFFNSSWWMIAGGRIYSNQIRTTKTQHS